MVNNNRMTKQIKQRLQDQILKQRGLETTKYIGLEDTTVSPPDGIKTLVMRQIEARFGRPIEELLMDGSLNQVASKLGIDFTTVSHWRERLELR